MTYYYSDLKACAEKVKAINITVAKKDHHFSKAGEIKEIQQFCFDKTQDWNFEYECSSVKTYFNMAYNFKIYSKKELDAMLMRCVRSLQYELNAILAAGQCGEVNLIYNLEV